MKKFRYIFSLVLVSFIFMSFIFAGCQAPAKPNPPDQDYQRQRPDTYNNPKSDEMIDNVAERAQYIANNVEDIEGINNAAVVIMDNTAIIGVNLDGNLEGRITNNLKRQVERVTRNTDRRIENVAVTADVDLYERLVEISREVNRGRPVSGFANEIQEILRRITPSL